MPILGPRAVALSARHQIEMLPALATTVPFATTRPAEEPESKPAEEATTVPAEKPAASAPAKGAAK